MRDILAKVLFWEGVIKGTVTSKVGSVGLGTLRLIRGDV